MQVVGYGNHGEQKNQDAGEKQETGKPAANMSRLRRNRVAPPHAHREQGKGEPKDVK